MDVEVNDGRIIECEATLQKVNEDHCVVVGVSSLPFTVTMPPVPKEGHADSAFPVLSDVGIATRAIKLLSYSLPGLLPGPDGLWEREDETE